MGSWGLKFHCRFDVLEWYAMSQAWGRAETALVNQGLETGKGPPASASTTCRVARNALWHFIKHPYVRLLTAQKLMPNTALA